jgi:anti-anti-sigma factor
MAAVTLIENGEDATVLAVSGRLDVEGVEAVGDRFTAMISGAHKSAIVDLSEVSFIASVGLGMLVREAKALAAQHARMVALRPSETVDRVLRVALLDTVIPIAQSLDEARRLLHTS